MQINKLILHRVKYFDAVELDVFPSSTSEEGRPISSKGRYMGRGFLHRRKVSPVNLTLPP